MKYADLQMHSYSIDNIVMYVWLKIRFGLVIGIINHLQVVTTINYYIIAALHNLQSLHNNLQSICTSLHRFITQEL
jgi:hypothetical protein